MTPRNRLADAASAYLTSAAHQPVHWHPWGSEAFATAKSGDRPILLDIGAVWCHWCHVMDGESYEDPSLAGYLNEHFVCVKVDRDERPDVDARYQRAVQALTGQGGWPLTAFLTPDGQVFYGGTYFPPDGKYGRPGFRSVLEQVLHVYRTQRDRVAGQALALTRAIEESLDETSPGAIDAAIPVQGAEAMIGIFDSRNGGFGAQPKFPHPAALRFLLARWHNTGDRVAREIVERTLDGMARGGFHDQLGGGFHRYSVDARWIVPHFEKMASDNAELLRAYLDGYAAFGTVRYAEVARGVVRWIREVLADPDGGYGASQDADVGLEDDGDYFTWSRAEAEAVLSGEEFEVAAAYYDIGTAGEMHHDPSRNVLFVAIELPALARQLGLAEERAGTSLASARDKMIRARSLRPAPFIDRTRYTNWNAMLAGALLQAGAVLDDPWASEHALRSLTRLRKEQAEPDAVAHSPGGVTGLLDDQVQAAAAALDAHEHTGDRSWLDWALALMDRAWHDYRDPDGGGLYDTVARPGGEGLLPARARPVQDAPSPSGNGVAAINCARLFELTGDSRWRDRRDEILRATAGRAAELGLHGATMLLAVDWAVGAAGHLVVEGRQADGRTGGRADSDTGAAMHRLALRTYLPRRVVQFVQADSDTEALPVAVRGMLSSGTGPRGFACVGATCSAPADDLASWQRTLEEVQRR
jgi:uncharacterized protein YyaL (SSP411 family)